MYLKPPKTTREASDYQEKRILQMLPPSFRPSSNSGAGKVRKGDLFNKDWIIEAKTHMKPVTTHHVLYGDLRELHKHGLAAGKQTVYVFDFGYGTEILYELTRNCGSRISDYLPTSIECITAHNRLYYKQPPGDCDLKTHQWFSYISTGLSFKQHALDSLMFDVAVADGKVEIYIEVDGLGAYRIKLFDPRNYM